MIFEHANRIDPPKQPTSIEEAAEAYAISKDSSGVWVGLYRGAFIEAAKSRAAKDYWYEQFKQEKK